MKRSASDIRHFFKTISPGRNSIDLTTQSDDENLDTSNAVTEHQSKRRLLLGHAGSVAGQNIFPQALKLRSCFADGLCEANAISNPEAEALAHALNSCPTPTLTKARVTYLTKDAKSWVLVAQNWKPSSRGTFDEQWALHPPTRHALMLYGKVCHETRFSQAWGISYRYSGNVNQARPLSENPFVQELITACNELLSDRGPYNGCLQNWYQPDHSIALHSDDERSLRFESPIFSLSWGGPRRFVLRSKQGEGAHQCVEKVEFMLADGDLVVMGGSCQVTHRHEVPLPRKTKDPKPTNRINFTIRAFVR